MKSKISVCPKCGQEEEVFPYHVLPQHWHNGRGRTIFLCQFCLDALNNHFPLNEVLSEEQCEERMKKFLIKKYSP